MSENAAVWVPLNENQISYSENWTRHTKMSKSVLESARKESHSKFCGTRVGQNNTALRTITDTI